MWKRKAEEKKYIFACKSYISIWFHTEFLKTFKCSGLLTHFWGSICVPSCIDVGQTLFLSPGKVEMGVIEVSFTTTTLCAWPNGDEKGWLLAKAGNIVPWAQWETEAKKAQIFSVSLSVCVFPCSFWFTSSLKHSGTVRDGSCCCGKSASGMRFCKECEWSRNIPLHPCDLFKYARSNA